MDQSEDQPSYLEIVLVRQQGGWLWSIASPQSPGLEGPAPDRRSACRSALFAAGALMAFAKIGRRRF